MWNSTQVTPAGVRNRQNMVAHFCNAMAQTAKPLTGFYDYTARKMPCIARPDLVAKRNKGIDN